MPDGSELHLWRVGDGFAVLAEVEIFLLRETERGGEQRSWEALDAGIVFLHRIVEEAPRRRDLVLEIRKLRLQLLEIGAGLEVRIGFREREQLPQRAREHVLGGGLLRRPLRRHGRVARFDDLVQRAAFVRGVALYRLDQVGNEIVPLLELHVDIGKGLVDPLPHGNQAVVDRNRPQNENDDHRKYNEGRGHDGTPWGRRDDETGFAALFNSIAVAGLPRSRR